MTNYQALSDEELASDSSTGGRGQIATIEMLRRVKGSNGQLRETMIAVRESVEDLETTLHREEVAIKDLTRWLVRLTVGLVGLTVALLLFAVVQAIDMHQLKALLHR